VTGEFWELLLSLRVKAVRDQSVLEAVLFGLLTLLEVQGGERRGLAEEWPKLLDETQRWVEVVFERLEGGGAREEEVKVRSLAAGVLVKCHEVFEAYQRMLVRRGVDF